jgi:hypothetical protein
MHRNLKILEIKIDPCNKICKVHCVTLKLTFYKRSGVIVAVFSCDVTPYSGLGHLAAEVSRLHTDTLHSVGLL